MRRSIWLKSILCAYSLFKIIPWWKIFSFFDSFHLPYLYHNVYCFLSRCAPKSYLDQSLWFKAYRLNVIQYKYPTDKSYMYLILCTVWNVIRKQAFDLCWSIFFLHTISNYRVLMVLWFCENYIRTVKNE